jgi:PST family polysaccharide transporter
MNLAQANSPWLRFLPEFLRAKLTGRHKLQAALGNSGWLVSDRLFRMGANFLVYLWVARYLGPTQYGQLNYAIALTSLAAALASLGADNIVIRELVKTPERRDVLLGSAMLLKLAGAALAMTTVVTAVVFLRPGDRLSLWLVVLFAVGYVTQSLNVIDLYFRGMVRSKYTVLSANAAFISMAVAKVILVLAKAPLIAFAATTTVEGLLTVIFLCIAYRMQRQNMFAWRVSASVLAELLRESWPLVLSGISIMISMRVDQVMIGQYMNDKEVGLYAAAAKFSEIWYFIPVTIASSTYPGLIESKKRDEALYYRRLQQLYDILVTLGIVVALATTILAGPMLHLLYGNAYAGSSGVLRILIWGGIPVCFGSAWSSWMLLENKARMMFYFQLNGAVVNVLLNILLIPHFGITGSAFATLISYWISHTILAAVIPSQRIALVMLLKSIFSFRNWFRLASPRTPLPETDR